MHTITIIIATKRKTIVIIKDKMTTTANNTGHFDILSLLSLGGDSIKTSVGQLSDDQKRKLVTVATQLVEQAKIGTATTQETQQQPKRRFGSVERKTKETHITAQVDLDGLGTNIDISTGIGKGKRG